MTSREKALSLQSNRLRVIALILSVAFANAKAAPISASDELIEAMIDAQTANVTYLIRAFGNSQQPSLGVSFTSSTDLVNKSFNFSSDTGSVFNSTAFSLNVSGAYNGTTNQWEMTSAGAFGGNAFAGAGTLAFDLSPIDPLIAAGASGSWLWGLFDYRSTVQIINPLGTRSAGDIVFTILGVDVGTASVTDQLQPVENPLDPNGYKYDWTIKNFHLGGPTAASPGIAPAGFLMAVGELNTLTGNGTLQVSIVSEPGTFSLMGIATVFLLAMKGNGDKLLVKATLRKFLRRLV